MKAITKREAMNKHEIACLALKIIAIYALVLLIGQIPVTLWICSGGIYAANSESFSIPDYAGVFAPLVLLAVVVVLLFGMNRTFA